MEEEWLSQKLQDLKIKENRNEILLEIKKRLHQTTKLEGSLASVLFSSSDIYQCIDDAIDSNNSSEDKLVLELINEILTMSLSNLTLTKNDRDGVLLDALNHKQNAVRAVALRAIHKQTQLNEHNVEDMISDELLKYLLHAFQNSEIEIGNMAYKILSLVLEPRLDQLLVIDAFKEAMQKNEIIKCRLYDLAVTLAIRSELTFKKVQFVLDDALKHLDSDDILLKVNILEVIAPLFTTDHGFMYLEEHKVMNLISDHIKNMEEDPLSKLLIAPHMKFFGKIAEVKAQKVFDDFPDMIRCLFDCLFAADATHLPAALDCFASLAASPEGIHLLEINFEKEVKKFFEICATSLNCLSTELKIRFFNNLEIIFNNSPKIILSIDAILKQWFSHLNGNSNQLGFLMSYCKNPFPDIKIACLNFIRVLCLYKWGLEAVKNTAGLLEYLMDRDCEFDKDVKYAKYLVIQLLAKSPIFDVQTHIQLQVFVNQGAYYVKSNAEVAMQAD